MGLKKDLLVKVEHTKLRSADVRQDIVVLRAKNAMPVIIARIRDCTWESANPVVVMDIPETAIPLLELAW